MKDKKNIKQVLLVLPLLLLGFLGQTAQADDSWKSRNKSYSKHSNNHRHNSYRHNSHRNHQWNRPTQYHYSHDPYSRVEVGLPRGHISLSFGGGNYYHSSGNFYRRGAKQYVVVTPPQGIIVSSIPAGYRRVVVDRVPYYNYNGVYYRQATGGYEVVEAPNSYIGNTTRAVGPDNAVTVSIPRNSGGFTSVVLKSSGDGFIGPRGEYYSTFPRVEQLKLVYQ